MVVSLFLAVVGFALPWLLRTDGFGSALVVSVLAFLIWVGVGVYAGVTAKRRALWLLVGCPLALYWPLAVVALIVHGGPT